MTQRLVIGAGPDAVRAAAVLATGGHRVLLLLDSPEPTGLRHAELPQSSGRMRTADEDRELAERILGPLVEAPGIGRGLSRRGTRAWLPMRRRDVPALISPAHLPAVARAWLQARQGLRAQELVSGGREERSYRDWVVRRMGEATYEELYRPYATRRWGRDPEELSVAVARVHHALPDDAPTQVAGGREQVALDLAREAIEAAGGEIRTGARVSGLSVQGGRVAAVRLADGQEIAVEGPLWVARAPATVVGWLDEELAAPLRQDAARLPSHDLRVTCLKGEVDGLPEELHVLDADAPFWCVVSPYGIKEYALFLETVPAVDAAVGSAVGSAGAGAGADESDEAVAARVAEAAERLGIGTFSVEGARVERVREHQPCWTAGAHARLHRLINRFQELGIVAVGRTGTFGELDPGQEIGLAAAYRDQDAPDQREALRCRVDPPFKVDDLHASIRHFLER